MSRECECCGQAWAGFIVGALLMVMAAYPAGKYYERSDWCNNACKTPEIISGKCYCVDESGALHREGP